MEPFQQSSFVLSPKQSSSIMSGYRRGRLLLGSSGSESKSERNSDSRRRSDATPYDRQPVPGVSNDNQSIITELFRRDSIDTAIHAVYHSTESIVHRQCPKITYQV